MKKAHAALALFKQFIKDSETGKRRKKNGERIRTGTIDNYRYVLNNLNSFSEKTEFNLRICEANRLTMRERKSEKTYWKKFYRAFTDFLYKKGCHDNYVGANIKTVRTFFTYLKHEIDIDTGDFQKNFYVRKEEVPILVLSPDQLKFLLHDTEFEASLTPALKKVKDIFVFGCTTGLRYSDLFDLTNKNFERKGDVHYLRIRSLKTKTYSAIRLSDYAVEIFNNYKSKSAKNSLFGTLSLFVFNRSLKELGKRAGFTSPIEYCRERLGKSFKLTQQQILFCDKMSSHMMRRTAITSMLILGMPEHLVRNISGHSRGSSSFSRYVHYAQSYIDQEIEKVYEKLAI